MSKEIEDIIQKLECLKEYKRVYYGSQWFNVEVCADDEMKDLIDKTVNYLNNSISKNILVDKINILENLQKEFPDSEEIRIKLITYKELLKGDI